MSKITNNEDSATGLVVVPSETALPDIAPQRREVHEQLIVAGRKRLLQDMRGLAIAPELAATLRPEQTYRLVLPKGTILQKAGAILSMQGGSYVDAAGGFTNDGALVMAGPTALLTSTTLTNNGEVRGNGEIQASLANATTGTVYAGAGDMLGFADTTHTNDGEFMMHGGTMRFRGAVTNNASGDITGRGVLMTDGLTNEGDVAFSSGITDVHGDVVNHGRVIISGNSETTFWDDVDNTAGTLFRVAENSSVTFFGQFEGGSGIDGPGSVYVESDLSPGSSPGTSTFGGNLHFGPLAKLIAELDGTTAGDEHDQVVVQDTITLDGDLVLALGLGFDRELPHRYPIIRAAQVMGRFDRVEGLHSSPGMMMALSYEPSGVFLVNLLVGDANGDGQVDGNDLIAVEEQFGATGEPGLPGDANGDGQVDGNDLIAVEEAFGAVARTSAAVPEPTSFLLLALGGMGLTGGVTARRANP